MRDLHTNSVDKATCNTLCLLLTLFPLPTPGITQTPQAADTQLFLAGILFAAIQLIALRNAWLNRGAGLKYNLAYLSFVQLALMQCNLLSHRNPTVLPFQNDDLILPTTCLYASLLLYLSKSFLPSNPTRTKPGEIGSGIMSSLAIVFLINPITVPPEMIFFIQLWAVLSAMAIGRRAHQAPSRAGVLSAVGLCAGLLLPAVVTLSVQAPWFDEFAGLTIMLSALLLQQLLFAVAFSFQYQALSHKRLFDTTHDLLTGLPNRILLLENIERLVQQQHCFTLVLLRAQRFRELKPALGLLPANRMVATIVARLAAYIDSLPSSHAFETKDQKAIRLCRLEEDIFALVMTAEQSSDALQYHVLAMQEVISLPIDVGGFCVSTHCAVGAIQSHDENHNAEALLQKATHSLEVAARHYGSYDLYRCAEEDIQAQFRLLADLQDAIDSGTLEVYHQVQINLCDHSIYGNEALVRWQHPLHGQISPAIFIALAESTGLIFQLTEYVIDTALKQHKQLLQAGHCQVTSINLSAKDLQNPGLVAHIMVTLANFDIPPSTVLFELTESAACDCPHHAFHTIGQLQEMGLSVAIDDFGTGYSCLEYLARAQFKELKLDKSFVTDIIEGQKSQTITRATVEMAKHLNILVVAEGIETPDTEALLRSYGCEIGQGFYYARPQPLSEYLRWLNEKHNHYADHNLRTTGSQPAALVCNK